MAAKGLLSDPALSRSMLLPFGKRTYQDYEDDISEYDELEFALPSAIADPLGLGGLLAKQALTGQRMNPNDATQAMIDVGMLSTPIGLLGGVPKGAVLGANVGGNISEGIRKAYADQGRMLANKAPIGARGQELLMPVPYSKTLKIPKSELDELEQGLLRQEAPNMGKRKILNLEDIEGENLFPLIGDRTSRETLTQIAGQKLNEPITTQGGFGYPMGKDTGGWASHAGVISRIKNAVDQQGGGVGVAMPMAGTGSDYSMHSIDVLYGLNLPSKMTKRAHQTIKNLVNSRIETKNSGKPANKKMPKFKGLDNSDAYDYFLKNPDARKFLMESIDNKDVRSIPSMPDAVMLRHAVTDASLKDMMRGDTDALAGQALVRFKPDAGVAPAPHKSYATNYEGEYMGGLLQAVPSSLLLPQYYAKKLGEGYRPDQIKYLATRDLPFEKVTPQMTDTVNTYIENLIRQGGM